MIIGDDFMKRTWWSEEELDYLKKNAKNKSVEEMSNYLQRTPKAIRNRLEMIGISLRDLKNIKFESWSEEEDNFLKNNYHLMTVKKLQEHLDRTEKAIRSRKNALSLNNKYGKLRELRGKEYYINSNGYYLTYDKEHKKYKGYHRVICEEYYGIKLKSNQYIHHIDGNKKNNKIENLLLCNGCKEHTLIHKQLETISYQLIQEGYILFDKEKKQYIANPNRRLD